MKKILFLYFFIFSFLQASDTIDVQLSTTKENAARGIITFSITNKSNEDIEILKWGTPFEKELSADIFSIKNEKGAVKYIGRKVHRSAKPSKKSYVELKAGETHAVKVPVYLYYDFETRSMHEITYIGKFKYKLKGSISSQFYTGSKANVQIYFSYTKQKNILSTLKPRKFNTCTKKQIVDLNAAHEKAKILAKLAAVKARINTENEVYERWFGTTDHSERVTIYDSIEKALATENIVFDCTCSIYTEDEAAAYVYPTFPYYINMCEGFFSQLGHTGFDSQAGVVIHEMSHFSRIADTEDHGYSMDVAKGLAKDDPSKAIDNADNYMYFAEDILENYFLITTIIERKEEFKEERLGNSMVSGPRNLITTNVVETKSKQLMYIDFDNRKVILLPLKDQDSSRANLQSYKFDGKACRYDLVTDTQIDKHIRHRQVSVLRHDVGMSTEYYNKDINSEVIIFQVKNGSLKKNMLVNYMDLLQNGYVLKKDTLNEETRRSNGISFGGDYDSKQDKAAALVLNNLPLGKKDRCQVMGVHDMFIGEGASEFDLSFTYEIEIVPAIRADINTFKSSNVSEQWEHRAVKMAQSSVDSILDAALSMIPEHELSNDDSVDEALVGGIENISIDELEMFTNEK